MHLRRGRFGRETILIERRGSKTWLKENWVTQTQSVIYFFILLQISFFNLFLQNFYATKVCQQISMHFSSISKKVKKEILSNHNLNFSRYIQIYYVDDGHKFRQCYSVPCLQIVNKLLNRFPNSAIIMHDFFSFPNYYSVIFITKNVSHALYIFIFILNLIFI